MMYVTIACVSLIPLGFLSLIGAFGTWGWNERLGIVSIVMGIFLTIVSIGVWESQYSSQCAQAGGIVLEYTCVEADAIIVLP